MKRLGLACLDVDASRGGFHYKLGYCQCGEKVLASETELAEIVNAFNWLEERQSVFRRWAVVLLRRMARDE